MLQAYQGYLKTEVQLISDNNFLIKIPTDKRITILWEEIAEAKESDKEKRIKERLAMVESLKGILPSDVDLESARDERISRRGLLDK